MKTSSIHRIGLPPQLNALYIERHEGKDALIEYEYRWNAPTKGKILEEEVVGYWLLPIHTNPDRTLGTYLKLYDDGKIERVTVREDEGDEVVLIKPRDEDIK